MVVRDGSPERTQILQRSERAPFDIEVRRAGITRQFMLGECPCASPSCSRG